MKPFRKPSKRPLLFAAHFYLIACAVYAWLPSPVEEDATVYMPGSQPDASARQLESVENCNNCHAGYAAPTNPYRGWQGFMMAHAARDPLWIASLAVANQDAIWALGSPNAADLCVRCHSPAGWLGGRSDPPNLSLLSAEDKEGVTCATCHRMVDPFTVLGQPDVPAENPGVPALLNTTRIEDLNILSPHTLFDQVTPFLAEDNLPRHYGDGHLPNYIEATSGQFFIDRQSKDIRRGPLTDPNTSHGWLYSRYHKSRQFCGACHDVSNPVLANLDTAGTSERQASASYYHAERTYSEFMLSAFGRNGGAPTSDRFASSRGITHASSCQDCHMPKADGKVAKRGSSPVRPQVATHDLTGANTWITRILASADNNAADETRNQWNIDLFSGNNPKYPGATIELNGLLDTAEILLDGADRAMLNLNTAASIEIIEDNHSSATVRIINHTGHKLISGYPEGRRMWLNVQFINGEGQALPSINNYEPLVINRDHQNNPVYVSGGTLSPTHDDLVYEAKLSSPDQLPDHTTTFHFLLSSTRYKDNRIPPKGFDITQAAKRLCLPVWQGTAAPTYFTAEEYAGGYDEVTFQKPPGTQAWIAHLYYQTTSREYVAFLRDEINGTSPKPLSSPTPSGANQAYIIQNDPYFAGLKDWGHAIWDLWLHNQGAPPEKMTTAIGRHTPPTIQLQNDGIHLRIPSLPDCTYQLQWSSDLSPDSWSDVGESHSGKGGVLSLIDSRPSTEKIFYRLLITEGSE